MFRDTPFPWFPLTGLITTGHPIFLAAFTASSAVRQTTPPGTGIPARLSSSLVTVLSQAMSAEMQLVLSDRVPSIFLLYFPYPS